VPVNRVKVLLFMATASSAALFACIQVFSFGSADVLRGQNKEFEAIITAVVGGTLLTGGYGSALGSAFGAFILGTTQLGINFVGINSDWYQVVLGSILLLAVLANTYLLRRASGAR
jgi:simple sugar transport system permease protein